MASTKENDIQKIFIEMCGSTATLSEIKDFLSQHPDAATWKHGDETGLLSLSRRSPSSDVADIAVYLINNGADVNSKTDFNSTSLHFACMRNNVALTDILLENGANIDAGNNMGNTPFLQALSSRHVDLAFHLLAQGANPNLRSALSTMWEDIPLERVSALVDACENYDAGLRQRLLEQTRNQKISQDAAVFHQGVTPPLSPTAPSKLKLRAPKMKP